MIHGIVTEADRYTGGGDASAVWTTVFEWLSTLASDAEEKCCDLPIPGVFARVMRYDTLPRDKIRFESHRRYIDLQCTLQGAEQIVWAPVQCLSVDGPYDDQTDFQFYHNAGSATMLDNQAGRFSIFFPEDGHAPMLSDGRHEEVLKVVVKIPVELVGS